MTTNGKVLTGLGILSAIGLYYIFNDEIVYQFKEHKRKRQIKLDRIENARRKRLGLKKTWEEDLENSPWLKPRMKTMGYTEEELRNNPRLK